MFCRCDLTECFAVVLNQMSNRLSYTAVCFLAIACAATAFGQNAAAPLSADALLRDVIDKYRTLKAYSADGTFIHGTPPDREVDRGSLQIRFVRPSLKFESQSTLGPIRMHGIWWSNERANYTWSTLWNRVN